MEIADLIAPSAVLVGVRAADKRKSLKLLAERASTLAGLDAGLVVQALLRREELGSTGMGEGTAIPHVRIDGVVRPFGLFARLRSPIDWAAIDERPVDLVCLLLLPAAGRGSEPLAALSCVARQFRDSARLEEMRRALDERALYEALASSRATDLSA